MDTMDGKLIRSWDKINKMIRDILRLRTHSFYSTEEKKLYKLTILSIVLFAFVFFHCTHYGQMFAQRKLNKIYDNTSTTRIGGIKGKHRPFKIYGRWIYYILFGWYDDTKHHQFLFFFDFLPIFYYTVQIKSESENLYFSESSEQWLNDCIQLMYARDLQMIHFEFQIHLPVDFNWLAQSNKKITICEFVFLSVFFVRQQHHFYTSTAHLLCDSIFFHSSSNWPL